MYDSAVCSVQHLDRETENFSPPSVVGVFRATHAYRVQQPVERAVALGMEGARLLVVKMF